MTKTKASKGKAGEQPDLTMVAQKTDKGHVELVLFFDGMRIAHRGYPSTPEAGTWVSEKPGYEVVTSADHSHIEVRQRNVSHAH